MVTSSALLLFLQLGWTVTPSAECLGAELLGPDLSSRQTDQELQAIRAALLAYEVIFFRDQANMHPREHVHLAEAFGKVQLHEAYPHVSGYPGTPLCCFRSASWHRLM